MTDKSSSLDLPATSFAVLGLLSFQPMSGYDLKLFADRSIGHFYWSPAKSQIYAELRRLKQARLVTDEHVEQEGRPDKRVYAITNQGQIRLTEWVNSSPFEQDVFKSTLMLRVFFGQSADTGALLNLLHQNLTSAHQRLAELQGMEQNCLSPDNKNDSTFALITIRAGIHLTEATVKWTEESIKVLEERSASEQEMAK